MTMQIMKMTRKKNKREDHCPEEKISERGFCESNEDTEVDEKSERNAQILWINVDLTAAGADGRYI